MFLFWKRGCWGTKEKEDGRMEGWMSQLKHCNPTCLLLCWKSRCLKLCRQALPLMRVVLRRSWLSLRSSPRTRCEFVFPCASHLLPSTTSTPVTQPLLLFLPITRRPLLYTLCFYRYHFWLLCFVAKTQMIFVVVGRNLCRWDYNISFDQCYTLWRHVNLTTIKHFVC